MNSDYPEFEFCSNIKPFMQPHPVRNPGGDCFACAFTAMLQHLFPDKKITFDKVYDYFRGKYYKSDKECINNAWIAYNGIFNRIKEEFPIEHKPYIVLPNFQEIDKWTFAWYQFNNDIGYFSKVHELLLNGWVLMTSIDNDGKGSRYYSDNDKRYYNNSTNHIILFDGVKAVWESVDGDCRRYRKYVHVVCSAKGVYWVKLDDFIDLYGAAAWWQVRRI